MFKTLLLFCAVLLLLVGTQPALAGRPTAYARAKMHGRVYMHRPSYKVYKGFKRHRGLRLFSFKGKSHGAKPAARHSARTSRL